EHDDERHRAPGVLVGPADGRGRIRPARQAAVHEHPGPRVSGQAGAADGGPVAGVFEHVPVRPGDLRHGVPVAPVPVRRYVAVDDEQLVAPVVVQVAQLRSPGPPGVGDDAFGALLEPSQLRQEVEAQVVALEQVGPLRDVGHERIEPPAVQHVAERGRHAALRVTLQAGLREHEPLAGIVDEQLFRPVVVREEQVGPAVAVEVRGGGGEGPAGAAHSHLVGDVFEPTVPEVMEQAILPAVGRELEAVVHDAGRPQIPEIDVGAEVAGDVEIEQPVPVVVEPHRPIAVHPLAQSRGGGHVLEMQVAEVLEQLEVSPLVDEQVLEPVVVVVAPHGTHRHALAWAVQVGDARAPRDVDERAVAPVEIERVGESEPAVREVEVGPAVVVDVADGHGRLERDAATPPARTLGLAYLPSEQLAQAETAFSKIVALAPDQALGYANLGLVHLRLGRYDVAEREIRRAAARDTASDDIALTLAKVYELTGRTVEARHEVDRVLRRSPDDLRALYELAALDPASKETYLRRIVGRAP